MRFNIRRGTLIIAVVASILKLALSIITPLNFDFINIANLGAFKDLKIRFLGPYTFTAYFMNLFYRLWLILPVEHPPVSSFLRYNLFKPSVESFAFVAVMKLPLLLSDLATGLLIYKIVKEISDDPKAPRIAFTLWILNPLSTILIEMDGTIDIVSTCFTVLSVYAFLKRRVLISGAVLAVAAIARFWPLTVIPIYLVVLLRRGERRLRGMGKLMLGFSSIMALAVCPFVAWRGFSFIEELWLMPSKGQSVPEFTWFFGHLASTSSIPLAATSTIAVAYVIHLFLIRSLWRLRDASILDGVEIPLLLFLAFSHWNRYYSIWVLPFLTVDYAVNRDKAGRRIYGILLAVYFICIMIYAGRWIFNGAFFLAPLTPQIAWFKEAFSRAWMAISNSKTITSTPEERILENLARSIMAGISIIIAGYITLRNLTETPISLTHPRLSPPLKGRGRSYEPTITQGLHYHNHSFTAYMRNHRHMSDKV